MTAIEAEQPEGQGFGLVSALPDILWQRRWLIVLPAVLTTVAGAIAAYTIHPVYQSSATVLIESQQLPQDLLGASSQQLGDQIAERVARARERVLSRQELIRLIRAYNLYPDQQQSTPLSKIVDKMREDTSIASVDSALVRRAYGGNSTIALTIAFAYDDPIKAQTIAQQYVNHFLEVDATTQAAQATDTVNFLTEQANGLNSQVAAVEAKIMAIKSQNGTLLTMGQFSGNPVADLARIESEMTGLRSDNMKLAAVPAARDEGGVAQAEATLRALQARFSDTHPDVIAARAQVESARRASGGGSKVDSVLSAQLAANRAQMASLERARALIQSQSSSYQSAAARAPVLTGQVDQLEKQADALRDQQRSIAGKLQAAQIQSRVETEQKGERLTLSDPPVVPDSPMKPNRPVLIMGAIIAGLAIGVGLALLLELILRPIRGTTALKNILGEAPLAVVPDLDHKPGWLVRRLEQRTRKKMARA